MRLGCVQRWLRELLSSKLCLENVKSGIESVLDAGDFRNGHDEQVVCYHPLSLATWYL
jgi:hypothetical protein